MKHCQQIAYLVIPHLIGHFSKIQQVNALIKHNVLKMVALCKILIVCNAINNAKHAQGHCKQIACLVILHLIGPFFNSQKINASIKLNAMKILDLYTIQIVFNATNHVRHAQDHCQQIAYLVIHNQIILYYKLQQINALI